MNIKMFSLSIEQTEILYNLENQKILNDIRLTQGLTNKDSIIDLKNEWLNEWRSMISISFQNLNSKEDIVLNWYSELELLAKIKESHPNETWFRLILLEVMLFEPYHLLSIDNDEDIISETYKKIHNEYSKNKGDNYIDSLFIEKDYYQKGYIKRLRKTYNKVYKELNSGLKKLSNKLLSPLVLVSSIAILGTIAGIKSDEIAKRLVGSNFSGLNGAALISASLAHIGNNAKKIGLSGMSGGRAVIVGGGVLAGAITGKAVTTGIDLNNMLILNYTNSKEIIFLESAKLIAAVREIFLNDNHDIIYANEIYEQYSQNISKIEINLVELKSKVDTLKENQEIENIIKNLEDTIKIMKTGKKSLEKFINSFEEGLKLV